MKKWIWVFAMVSLCFLGYQVYDKIATDETKKEDARTYIKEVAELNALQVKVMTDYRKNVLGNANPNQANAYLKTNVLPSYDAFQKKVIKVKTETDALKTLHADYVKAVALQKEALTDYVHAFDKNDEAWATKGDKKAKEANHQFDRFEKTLITFGREFGIVLTTEAGKKVAQ